MSVHAVPQPQSVPLLDVRNLFVRFSDDGTGFDVVRGISFSVASGKTLCLVGESGSGKSMTALALLRLAPQGSRVRADRLALDGLDTTDLSESAIRELRGRQCAMIFQEPMTSLNPVLRIGDQVAEPLMAHMGMPRAEARDHALEALRQVGIPAAAERMRDYPHQLSGGMRQRVMIAMALVCGPRLLLADEPTTALDVTIQGQILDLLHARTVERGMGLVLITHDLNVVAETADEVCVMYAGQIVEQAPVAEIFARPLHPYTQGLMEAAPSRERRGTRLITIAGTVPPARRMPPGCAFAPRCPRAMPACSETPPEMYEPVPGHTARCLLCAGT